MPDVGSNQFRVAKGTNNFVSGVPYGKDGTTGGPNNDGWKYARSISAHNGAGWVEVWNARPEMVSSTFTVSNSTTLSFTGSADPNNFATTATFEYREVGGTYADGNTTTTSLGNGVDGAVGFSLTKTGIDGFKNWEARAKGTNIAGVGVGEVISRDCRKGVGWGRTSSSIIVVCSTCDSCGTSTKIVTTDTYTKDGCPTYSESSEGLGCSACGTWAAGQASSYAYGGQTLYYSGSPGFYFTTFQSTDCAACAPLGGSECWSSGNYYITDCDVSDEIRVTFLGCDACVTFGIDANYNIIIVPCP
jgi:hypothetical protein